MRRVPITSRPQLDRPVLIAAFRGWNDGGQGASLAGAYLARAWAGTRFADIDPEGFYDFQSTRPMVSLVEGVTRQIEWPENAFFHAPLPGAGRDSILLLGIEPNLRWRTFAGLVTRPPGSSASSPDHARLAARRRHTRARPRSRAVRPIRADRPAGAVDVTLRGPIGTSASCTTRAAAPASPRRALGGRPALRTLTPSPRAKKALKARTLLGADVDTAESTRRRRVPRQVSQRAPGSETSAYVELERRRRTGRRCRSLPRVDAAELSRFERANVHGQDS
jgi:hypothetical protein